MEAATELNMELICVPTRAIAPMQITAMRASSRPYSASVAPSSLRVTYFATNFLADVRNFFMDSTLSLEGTWNDKPAHRASNTNPESVVDERLYFFQPRGEG